MRFLDITRHYPAFLLVWTLLPAVVLSQTQSSSPPTPTITNVPAPSSTPSPSDPCSKGVCKVASRNNQKCIVMQSTNTCKEFVGYYLPVDLRSFFDKYFPAKNPDNIPHPVTDKTQFDLIYATQGYSYPTRYIGDYMRQIAGCSMPNQLYYKTSYCMSILDHFANTVKDPCAMSSKPPKICASTLDKRADSVDADLRNGTACAIGSSARDIGSQYTRSLRTHPWRATDGNAADCISGERNESDFGQSLCGYTDELTACSWGCASVPAATCQRVLANADSLKPAAPDVCDENNRTPCQSSKLSTGFIVLIVIACIVVAGLGALFYTRRRVNRDELLKPEPMTMPRPNAHPVDQEQPQINKTSSIPAPQQNSAMFPGSIPTNPNNSNTIPMAGSDMYMTPPIASEPSLTPNGSTPSNPTNNMAPVTPQTGSAITPLQPMCTGVDPTEATIATVCGLFPGTQDGELALQPGDLVTVHNRFDDGWALGTRHPTTDGRQLETGYFPAAYLMNTPVTNLPSRTDSLSRRVR